MKLTTVKADQVFTAAANATFRRTNLGMIADVTVGLCTYRVVADGTHLAFIDSVTGFGGEEVVTNTNATPTQHARLAI